jgi:hypothetical protein
MREYFYYDRDGNVIEVTKWGALFEDLSYRFIGDEHVDGWRVATIWVGHDDYRWPGPDAPMIFETAIFPPLGTAHVRGYPKTYATLAQAQAGHATAVALVRTGGIHLLY